MPPCDIRSSSRCSASCASGRAGAERVLPEEAEDRRVGKFRRAAQAALLRVGHAQQRRATASRCAGVGRSPGCAARLPRQHPPQRSGVLRHGLVSRSCQASATPCSTWRNDGRPQRGSGGKYVPPQNGAPSGRQEHGQRPAALLAQRVQRRHVEVVDVGAFLAIDLDVDEQARSSARRYLGPRRIRAP